MMALYVATRVSVQAKAFMTLRALLGSIDKIARMRGKDEMGVQRDSQDFRSSIQRGHHVTDSHLWVEPGPVGIRGEQISLGFWEAMASCFSSAHITLTKAEQSRSAIVSRHHCPP